MATFLLRSSINPFSSIAASLLAISLFITIICFSGQSVMVEASARGNRALLSGESSKQQAAAMAMAMAGEQDLMEWVRYHQKRMEEEEERGAKIGNVSTRSIEASEGDNAMYLNVAKGGGAEFTTVQAAIDAVPKKNTKRVVIQIAAGVYREKVMIPKTKPYITLQGAGSGSTTITYDDTQSDAGSTQDSATVGVNSVGFIAKGITFQNSAPPPGPGAVGRQAVALRINGDMAAFYDCSFLGAQDTLYDNHGRHYFENCYIEGSIDYIFGDGQSYYKDCTLHALSINPGSVTAQKRSSPSDGSGFSFVGCTISGSGLLYLGRAWGPYSRVVFSYTYMDNIIIPSGWNNWGDSSRQKTVFYGQYKCSGPGANQNGRVSWSHELTDAEAAPFLTTNFIDGGSWL